MAFAQFLLVLAVIPLLAYLLWPAIPVRRKMDWIDYLPSISVGILTAQILFTGFQAVLFGLYVFAFAVFLRSLWRMWKVGQIKPRRGTKAVIFGLLGVMMVVFCLIPAVLLPISYETPVPTGPYAVGTIRYGWEDTGRPETFTPDPADHRKIAVQFWYPVDATDRYQPGSTPVEEAPISKDQDKYPLVVFSHGAYGFRGSNTSTYQELASQGYIVASIDHTFHAFFTRFPDGESEIISQEFLAEVQLNQTGQMNAEQEYAIPFKWLDLRIADIRFTLDQVEALNAEKSINPLAGHIDLEKIGLFGHSLGGAASAAVCREDARCKAVAVIDATMIGEYDRNAANGTLIEDPFPVPMMIFYNGDTFYDEVGHEAYRPDLNAFENAADVAYGVVVNGAQHLNFTDLPARAPILAKLLGGMMSVNGGTAGEIPQALCTEILNQYLVEFFDQALLGEPSDLLSGAAGYAEVDLFTRAE